MNRISTAQAYERPLQELQQRQIQLARSQEQLTSGKRVARSSDDPTAAARAERALNSVSKVAATQRAVEASRDVMSQTESALGSAGELLQRARELLVAAGDAAYGDTQRASLSDELRGLRQQLLYIANRDDGAGSYLFAGQGSQGVPFVDEPAQVVAGPPAVTVPAGVRFHGTAGRAEVAGQDPLPSSMDGSTAWLRARTGNGQFETGVGSANTGSAWIDSGSVTDPAALTGQKYRVVFHAGAGGTTYDVLRDNVPVRTGSAYVANKAIEVDGMAVTVQGAPGDNDEFTMAPSQSTLSVFDTLDRAIADLATPNRTSTRVAQANLFALRDIDQSMVRLEAARSEAGGVLNRIDQVTDRLEGLSVAGQAERSNAEDLDMVHAISSFQAKQTGYDAALKSYAMVQRLSLFQYLGG